MSFNYHRTNQLLVRATISHHSFGRPQFVYSKSVGGFVVVGRTRRDGCQEGNLPTRTLSLSATTVGRRYQNKPKSTNATESRGRKPAATTTTTITIKKKAKIKRQGECTGGSYDVFFNITCVIMGRFQAAATRASAAHCPSGPMKAMVELLSRISVIRRMAKAVSPSFPTIHVDDIFDIIFDRFASRSPT